MDRHVLESQDRMIIDQGKKLCTEHAIVALRKNNKQRCSCKGRLYFSTLDRYRADAFPLIEQYYLIF